MQDILETLKTLNNMRRDDIEQWLVKQRKIARPFVTSSVDLRHSGMRLAPVDTNVYPAGFNNLSPSGRLRAARFFAEYFEERFPHAKRLLIIPENHTRNMGYLENLAVLMSLIEKFGIEVELGSLAAEAGQPIELDTLSGRHLTEKPITRKANRLVLEDGFDADVILLNNDLTSGKPELLSDLSQPIIPPTCMGWWQRRKSVHFEAYRGLIENFCKQFDMDPWWFAADFHRCGLVDFKESAGLDLIAKAVDKILIRAQQKHEEYGIQEAPYVFIKAESGTYGMGIMTAHSADDVLQLNKKTRNKMNTVKEGAQVSEVIIQEGIATIDRIDGKPAEPMIYMVDGIPVGGMFRVNGERDAQNNLNAAGMEFKGMCDETEDPCGEYRHITDCHFRSFGTIAAIAALAAAREDYNVGKDGAGI
ncbi:MAG: glutamate--cysteine ligase [Rickettsiales bacterium]|nr:glutamate--cysteine ligase [Rickettsiales bacterium]